MFGLNVGTESKEQNTSFSLHAKCFRWQIILYSGFMRAKRERSWGQQPWELLKRKTEEMEKPYEMRHEKKVENKIEALEICKKMAPPSVHQKRARSHKIT